MTASVGSEIPAAFRGRWESGEDVLVLDALRVLFSFGDNGQEFSDFDVTMDGATLKLTCQDDILGETYYLLVTAADDNTARVEYTEVHAVVFGKTVVMTRAAG